MNKPSKIVLIYPTNTKAIPKLPLSVLALAGPLMKAGYNVEICDVVFDDYTKIDYTDVLFLGVSSYTDSGIKAGLEISEYVKNKFPEIPIVWGGPHPTTLPIQTIKNKYINIICKEEGEVTVVELANAIYTNNSLANIKGIVWKDNDGIIHNNPSREFIDLNNIEEYPYHILDIERYHWSINQRFYYESSRGCPYYCTFCSFDLNKKFRAKSAKKIVDDIESIQNKFNTYQISFLDSEFFTNKKRVREFCEEVIKRNLKIKWDATCRANLLVHYEDGFIKLLKKSGCESLSFGAESGSDRILASIKKRITKQQTIDVVKKLKDSGILINLGFMCGFPEETEDDINQTLLLIDQILKINKNVEIGTYQIYTPYPGSELFIKACDLGYRAPENLEEWPLLPNISYEFTTELTPWISKKRLKKLFIITTLVRFAYMCQREKSVSIDEKIKILYNSRILYYLYKIFNTFFILSYKIRWKYRLFSFAYEWYIWRYLRKTIINYY